MSPILMEEQITNLGRVICSVIVRYIEIAWTVPCAGWVFQDGGWYLRLPCAPWYKHRAPRIIPSARPAVNIYPIPVSILGIVVRTVRIPAAKIGNTVALMVAILRNGNVDDVRSLIARKLNIEQVIVVRTVLIIWGWGINGCQHRLNRCGFKRCCFRFYAPLKLLRLLRFHFLRTLYRKSGERSQRHHERKEHRKSGFKVFFHLQILPK